MKKLISIMLCCAMAVLPLCACQKDNNSSSNGSGTESMSKQGEFVYNDPINTLTPVASQDKYRNVYELLLYTYSDSNGDETGDINGLISKLDYLNDGDPASGEDLGVDAIWMLPFTAAKSYHKYDTYDYYQVDEEYGTLEDFKKLTDECHKRGIKVIMDLALNHTSTEHEWFKKAREELANGKTDGYAQMYSLIYSEDKPAYFAGVPEAENWWYECNFMPSFPELNLSSDMTRKEIENIIKYWTENGVDGFRLDGVKYYNSVNKESTDKTDAIEFLGWLNETAQKYNPDVYFVGELWDSSTTIKKTYASGIDSLFNFDGSGSTGKYANAIKTNNVYKMVSSVLRFQNSACERNENYIDANFLSNHDQMRIADTLTEPYEQKLAAAMYMLSPGNSFIYYGEELGLGGTIGTQDASYRTAMVWSSTDSDTAAGPPPGYEVSNIPQGGGVKEQLKDSESVLNFYRRIIKLKEINPEIARGRITQALDLGNPKQAGFCVEYNNEKKVVLFNIADETVTVELPDDILKDIELYGDLYAGNTEDYKTLDISGGKITMPQYSVVVLGEKK